MDPRFSKVFPGDEMNPHFSVANIKRLTDLHIRRFERRIKAGQAKVTTVVNVEECQLYLALWKGIEAKDWEWEKLDETERNEVMEAIDDEAQE